MWTHSKALLSSKDMNVRQHSATGMLQHLFHTSMSFNKLWVAYCSLASTSTKHFNAVTRASVGHQGPQVGLELRIHQVLLANTDMGGRQHSATGVLPHPFHTPMSVHKLWVANCSLASTLATRFATVAAGLRSGPSQNVDPFQGPSGQ